jgi:hypothetical protein
VYKVLMGRPEGKRPLGRPRSRWEEGIRMDLREIGRGSVEWIQLAQDRDRWRALPNMVMNLRVLAPRSWLVGSSWLTVAFLPYYYLVVVPDAFYFFILTALDY